MVLVAYQIGGYGAWSGTGKARLSLDNATHFEIENADGNRTFVEIPPVDRTGKEKSFDDIVLWRSQDMIFASQGNSCSLP